MIAQHQKSDMAAFGKLFLCKNDMISKQEPPLPLQSSFTELFLPQGVMILK